MNKFVGLGTLFILALGVTDLVIHPTGTAALGTAANGLLTTGGNQLLGVTTGK